MEWQGVHGDYFQPGLTAHWNRLSSTPCIRGAWCGRTTDPGEVTWGIPPLITKQRPTNVEIETWDIMGIPWAMGIIHLQNYDATSSLFCKRWKETVASFEPPSKKEFRWKDGKRMDGATSPQKHVTFWQDVEDWHSYWKWSIYGWVTYWPWWFSIVVPPSKRAKRYMEHPQCRQSQKQGKPMNFHRYVTLLEGKHGDLERTPHHKPSLTAINGIHNSPTMELVQRPAPLAGFPPCMFNPCDWPRP